jgi:H+-transporting ATPase
MVLIMITGDFLGMALTTDNVRGSPKPNTWEIGHLTIAGLVMGLGELVFCTAVLMFGAYRMGYDIGTLRTLTFVVIVFGNQATSYNNRERRRLWASRPSLWLAASSLLDIGIASTLAISGIAMTRLPAWLVGAVLAAAVLFAFLLDLIKVPVFARLGFAPRQADPNSAARSPP